MTVRCEVPTYGDSSEGYLIVEDAGLDTKFVKIKVGNETVKVNGKELMSAVQRCLEANIMALNLW